MSDSNIKILSAVFVLLLAAVFLRDRIGPKGPQPLFEGKSLNFIEVSQHGSKASVELKDGKWYQDRWPVDSDMIQKALKGLSSIKLDEMISSNSLKYTDFEVNDSSAVVVRAVSDTGAEAIFLIGKRSGEWLKSYIRMRDSREVYIVSGINKEMFSAVQDAWRERDIIELDDAVSIRLDAPSGNYDIIRDTVTWPSFSRELSGVRAEGFIEDSGKYASYIDAPLYTIKVVYSSDTGASYKLISDGIDSMVLFGDLLYKVKRDLPEKLAALLLEKKSNKVSNREESR